MLKKLRKTEKNHDNIIEREQEKEQESTQQQEVDSAPMLREDPLFEEPDVQPSKPDVASLEAAYCLGAGIDEETLGKARSLISEFGAAASGEIFSPEALKMAVKILNYERDIEEAYRHGMEEGRADSVAERSRSARSRIEKAEAVPHFNGSKGGAPREDSIFDVARKARQ